MNLTNPILKGFNPDPSILRVGDDYYIATSTFEWFPGVQIHHSKDLVNWKLVSRPLDRIDMLDMRGVPDSCGVWAPCLTYADGLFWLCFTNVKRFDGNFKDTHNYLTTCSTVDGEWSTPVYVNSSGFDPSLFHGDDGRKWWLNMIWDHRYDPSPFGGVYLQEYSVKEQKLIGEKKNIFRGSELGFTEGPHLYKRDGFYYLLTAEGGTGYNHAMTMARSKNIDGPYEVDPIAHFITAKDSPEINIQRTGHGDWVETPDGKFYAVHLCSRPLSLAQGKTLAQLQRSPMGRETAIAEVFWNDDGWLRIKDGGNSTAHLLPESLSHSANAKQLLAHEKTEFYSEKLAVDFQWLRHPNASHLFSLSDRKGYLRLIGRESIGSLYDSTLVARRQQAFCFEATTYCEFAPKHFQQMAGLTCYYNSHKFYYLYISTDEVNGRYLNIMSCRGDMSLALTYELDSVVNLPDDGGVYLRAHVAFDELKYFWSTDGYDWNVIGATLDYSLLSDEAGKGDGANFTGAFVGMCCQDISGEALPADFRFFEYREFEA